MWTYMQKFLPQFGMLCAFNLSRDMNSWQKAGLRRNRWCLVLNSSGSCYSVLSEQKGMALMSFVQLWRHYTGVTLSLCLFLIHVCYSSVALSSVPLPLSISLDLHYRSALVCLFFIHHSYWLSPAVQYIFLLFSLTWEASFHLRLLSLKFIISPSYSVLLFNLVFIDILILHILLPKQYKKKKIKVLAMIIKTSHINMSQWFKYAWDSMGCFVPVCLTEWTTNLYHLQGEI